MGNTGTSVICLNKESVMSDADAKCYANCFDSTYFSLDQQHIKPIHSELKDAVKGRLETDVRNSDSHFVGKRVSRKLFELKIASVNWMKYL